MRYISGARIAAGEVISPLDVERELVEINEQLEKGTEQLVKHSERLAQVTIDYELRSAQAMLRAKGKSIDQRKAEVLVAVEDLYREKVTLEAKVRLIRDCQHDLRAMLEAVRSMGASVRSAMWNDGQGQGGGGQRRTS